MTLRWSENEWKKPEWFLVIENKLLVHLGCHGVGSRWLGIIVFCILVSIATDLGQQLSE